VLAVSLRSSLAPIFSPLFGLHGSMMKFTSIVFLLFSNIVLANSHLNNGFWDDNISAETGMELGINFTITNENLDKGCKLFDLKLQSKIDSRKFRFISVYLFKDKNYAGGFDLAVDKTQVNTYTTIIEICDLAATKLQFNIAYGEKPESKSYIISFPIKPM